MGTLPSPRRGGDGLRLADASASSGVLAASGTCTERLTLASMLMSSALGPHTATPPSDAAAAVEAALEGAASDQEANREARSPRKLVVNRVVLGSRAIVAPSLAALAAAHVSAASLRCRSSRATTRGGGDETVAAAAWAERLHVRVSPAEAAAAGSLAASP